MAGALYLLPRPADVLGKAYIEIFRYRDGSETYDRRTEVDGPADEQVEQATAALVAELGSDVVVLGVRRHELPRIPENVLREAIANAVAHRTYETTGQPVRIEIRPDRVTITSPGGLPEPVTLANMRDQSAARNLSVIRTLRRYRLAEDAGMGVDAMEDSMQAALLERPRFDADAGHVEVILRLGSAVTPAERVWIVEIEQRGQIRPGDRLLLLHAARGELLTNTSARELLGVRQRPRAQRPATTARPRPAGPDRSTRWRDLLPRHRPRPTSRAATGRRSPTPRHPQAGRRRTHQQRDHPNANRPGPRPGPRTAHHHGQRWAARTTRRTPRHPLHPSHHP